MKKRFIAMILAVVLFALGFSCFFYTPSSQRAPNVYYFGFFETFICVIAYAGFLYLIAGIPFSIIIDWLIRKLNRGSKWRKYFWGLGMYSLAGAIVGALFIIFGGNIYWKGMLLFALPGVIASNLYFHLLLLISWKYKELSKFGAKV